MDLPEKNCAELTQQTANAIDDNSIHQLFVSTILTFVLNLHFSEGYIQNVTC